MSAVKDPRHLEAAHQVPREPRGGLLQVRHSAEVSLESNKGRTFSVVAGDAWG